MGLGITFRASQLLGVIVGHKRSLSKESQKTQREEGLELLLEGNVNRAIVGDLEALELSEGDCALHLVLELNEADSWKRDLQRISRGKGFGEKRKEGRGTIGKTGGGGKVVKKKKRKKRRGGGKPERENKERKRRGKKRE